MVPELGDPQDRKRRRVPRIVRDVLRAAFVGLLLATVGTLAARWTFVGDVIGSFRWQAGWCGVVLALALAMCRMRVLAMLALIASVYLLEPVVRPSLSRRDATVKSASAGQNGSTSQVGTGARDDTFRVESANVFFGNNAVDEMRVWMRADPPDVLAVQELPRSWREDFEDLSPTFPGQLIYPETMREWRDVGFGIALFTRLPVVSKRIVTLRPDCLPLLEMVVRVGARDVTVRTMHPPSPQLPVEWDRRNDVLARAANEVEWNASSVLLADLNTSSGSPMFRDLLARTDLCDSRRGFGRLPTWKTEIPFSGLWVDLDHILVGSSIVVLERDTREIPGSDHLAARATIAIPAR